MTIHDSIEEDQNYECHVPFINIHTCLVHISLYVVYTEENAALLCLRERTCELCDICFLT